MLALHGKLSVPTGACCIVAGKQSCEGSTADKHKAFQRPGGGEKCTNICKAAEILHSRSPPPSPSPRQQMNGYGEGYNKYYILL